MLMIAQKGMKRTGGALPFAPVWLVCCLRRFEFQRAPKCESIEEWWVVGQYPRGLEP
jgi:hypothetical protein